MLCPPRVAQPLGVCGGSSSNVQTQVSRTFAHCDVVGPAQHLDRDDAGVGKSADTVVIDEPLYAFYLKATGKKYPVAQEVIAKGETDWRK